MHAHGLGDILQRQRLQCRQALGQEIGLLANDLACNLERRAVALVERATKPAGRTDRLVDEGVAGLGRLAAACLADLCGIFLVDHQ